MFGRKKVSFGDVVQGSIRSYKAGTGMNPLANSRAINQVRAEREYGDNSWSPPYHGTTDDGRPVTVAFGKGNRAGHTLICDGHVSAETFYARNTPGKGHDHYWIGSGKDRGRYSG